MLKGVLKLVFLPNINTSFISYHVNYCLKIFFEGGGGDSSVPTPSLSVMQPFIEPCEEKVNHIFLQCYPRKGALKLKFNWPA